MNTVSSQKETCLQERFLSFYHHFRDPDYDLERELQFLLTSSIKPDPILKGIMTDISCFVDLYTLLAYTRDIHNGIGQRKLFYRQMLVWYNIHPLLTFKALEWCVMNENNRKPYGSWRDIRDIPMYIVETTGNYEHPLVTYCIELFVYQIILDTISDTPTLAAKWCPRERGKYKWFFRKIAKRYGIILEYISKPSEANTLLYSKFRGIVSTINRRLGTVETNLYHDTITFPKCSGLSLRKHIEIFKDMPSFISFVIKSPTIPSYGMDYYRFVADALKYKYLKPNNVKRLMLHKQWLSFVKYSKQLTNTMIFLDMGRNMEDDENRTLYRSIGMAIHLAHCTGQYRIMTYASSCDWVNIEDAIDFTDSVNLLFQGKWGDHSILENALTKTLLCGRESKPPPMYNKMTFIVLSNMYRPEMIQSLFEKDNRPKMMLIGSTCPSTIVSSEPYIHIEGYQIETVYRALLKKSKSPSSTKEKPTPYQHFHNLVRDQYFFMELEIYDVITSKATQKKT